MIRLDVDPDIQEARLPPRELYADEAWCAEVREAAFARSWQFLGAESDVAERGAVRPVALAAGGAGEPLLLARDGGGRLRLLSNVCTHRGHLVVEQPATQKSLRCPYHGRAFGLDGRCTGAPGFEEARDFPSESDALRELPLVAWRSLLFGSLAPARPWSEIVAPVDARLAELGGLADPVGRHEPSLDRSFEFDANWCLYVENYLEGLHIPFIHPGLNSKLDWKSYRYENLDHGTLQIGIAAPGEPVFALPSGHPDAADAKSGAKAASAGVGAIYFWLFPNLMLNFYPWGLSLNVVEPLSATRTRVRFHAFLARPELHDRGAGSGLVQVELEDERAAAQVQRGMNARLYRRGRYAPQAESGVHRFHRLLAAALASR